MARLQKTLTDYVVLAISPALIMLLIGSLVFFLLEVFYRGDYHARLQFIFGLFVMATVLIGRISIEEGREYAALFALPLGLVALLAVFRFVDYSGSWAGLRTPLNIGLLALIWWCADRLTWDCTVLDERADASGEGLLQTAGLDRPTPSPDARATQPTHELEATSSRETKPASGWDKFREYRRRPHAPGVWVIYFSLAALPLFGLGQGFIPAQNLDSRRYAFWLLSIYVASGLALLMTTSFLGLRRYLRQRRLEMPVEMAGVWLGLGSLLIVGLLLACNLLPRPSSEYSITQLSFQIRAPQGLRSSPAGTGHEGAPQTQPSTQPPGAGRQAGEASQPDGRPGRQTTGQDDHPPEQAPGATKGTSSDHPSRASQGQATQGQATQGQATQGQATQGQATQGQATQGQASQGQASQGLANGEQRSSGNAASEQAAPKPTGTVPERETSGGPAGNERPQPSPTPEVEPKTAGDAATGKPGNESQRNSAASTGSESQSAFSPLRMLNSVLGVVPYLLKWLYHGIFIVVVGYLVWRYRQAVLPALLNFFSALREFWEQLFGRRKSEQTAAVAPAAAAATGPPPRPFADFQDPFATGATRGYSPRQLVAYSFQALEAWSRERGWARGAEQTPHEFAQQLGAREARVAVDVRSLADLYCQAAYSPQTLTPESVAGLRRLWQILRSPAS